MTRFRKKKHKSSPKGRCTYRGAFHQMAVAKRNTLAEDFHEINVQSHRASRFASAVKNGLVSVFFKQKKRVAKAISLSDLAYVITGHRRLAGLLTLESTKGAIGVKTA